MIQPQAPASMEANDIGVQTTLVLDTNTVLALWMFRDPVLEPMRERLSRGPCRLFSREDALEELRRVLAYRQFAQSPEAQQALLDAYRQRLAHCFPPGTPDEQLPSCRDRDDQKFLEIALASGVCALITRDRDLLRLRRHRLIRDRFAILRPEDWQQRYGI